jgi:hypothetical protein
MMKFGFSIAILLLSAGTAFAQTAEQEPEPAAIVELGGATSWNVRGGAAAFGPDFAVEFTPIENFDGFEIDDFRDSGFGSGRDVGRSSSSDWNARTNLHNIHREEDRADRLDREGRQRLRAERPPLAREECVRAILSQRARTKYADRDKDYSLRDSEIHTLSEVGKFRVAATKDPAELAYNGDRARMESDV